ncbi:MAG TPA: hypothetical protein VL197_10855 [Nitrospirota bacterium]|nr:hypothetical protein [Nitrospirota bacterium]
MSELLDRADKGLSTVKTGGRNKTCYYEPAGASQGRAGSTHAGDL